MRREGERLEYAMAVYEDVRIVMDRLRDIGTDLNVPELRKFDATARAQEHLRLAREQLGALAEIMQALHMRPAEDSSDEGLAE
ncbi:MAG: hypothetical protein GYB66_01855 [Chloroflexi bacterium]|nr:hypothetical protein [Chloroflexota bacterium]